MGSSLDNCTNPLFAVRRTGTRKIINVPGLTHRVVTNGTHLFADRKPPLSVPKNGKKMKQLVTSARNKTCAEFVDKRPFWNRTLGKNDRELIKKPTLSAVSVPR
jgi:hypothetical protein